jgi:polyphosphate kinase
MKMLTLVLDREVRLMVDTQFACLTEDVLPALKKKGLNLVDYDELHLHEKDQVLSLNVFMLK